MLVGSTCSTTLAVLGIWISVVLPLPTTAVVIMLVPLSLLPGLEWALTQQQLPLSPVLQLPPTSRPQRHQLPPMPQQMAQQQMAQQQQQQQPRRRLRQRLRYTLWSRMQASPDSMACTTPRRSWWLIRGASGRLQKMGPTTQNIRSPSGARCGTSNP